MHRFSLRGYLRQRLALAPRRSHRPPAARFGRRPSFEPLEDRRLLSLDLVSVGLSGSAGNGSSDYPTVSSDGRYVAFESSASDLISGDTNSTDIFVRDLTAGTTIRVSNDDAGNELNGYSERASISGDGRYVTFFSNASNLAVADTNVHDDIFVKDLVAGVTTRGSTNSSGSQANGDSDRPSTSVDGRYVAFESLATNLASGDTNGTWDIFVKDLTTGLTTRASTDSLGNEADSYSYDPVISGDGRYVAFRSNATNLIADDTNGEFDVFVKDLWTGTTARVSTDSSGVEGNGDSYDASISSDGRYVAFESAASNLVADDTNAGWDIFVKDLQTGVITRVSTDSQGNQGSGVSSDASISGDGRFVAFASSSYLVDTDEDHIADIYIKDLATGAIDRVSNAWLHNADSSEAQISADGRYVTFSSTGQLTSTDGTATADVYRAWNPLLAPEIRLYSSSVAENQPAGTAIGTLSMVGADPDQTFTYSLVAGEGDTDNSAFTLDDCTLKTTAALDYETRASYSLRVQSTDSDGVTCEQVFAIAVTDLHDFASPALYDAESSTFYLRSANTSGMADYTFGCGQTSADCITLAGDWNGDAASDVGLYDPQTSTFYLTDAYEGGTAQYEFGYGEPGKGWIPLVGDWDGDGRAGVGLYDPQTSTFYLTNNLATGIAEYTFGFGEANAGWTPLVGDWNGDGHAGVGLYNPHASTFYLTNTFQTGFAEHAFGYGDPGAGWTPLVGDWDGDHTDGVGLFAPQSSTFYLTNTLTSGYAEYAFGYGEPDAGWTPLVGDWNGNGTSDVGLFCPTSSTFYLTDTLTSGYAEYTVGFGQPGADWQPLVGCWTTTGPAAQAVDQVDLADLAADALTGIDAGPMV